MKEPKRGESLLIFVVVATAIVGLAGLYGSQPVQSGDSGVRPGDIHEDFRPRVWASLEVVSTIDLEALKASFPELDTSQMGVLEVKYTQREKVGNFRIVTLPGKAFWEDKAGLYQPLVREVVRTADGEEVVQWSLVRDGEVEPVIVYNADQKTLTEIDRKLGEGTITYLDWDELGLKFSVPQQDPSGLGTDLPGFMGMPLQLPDTGSQTDLNQMRQALRNIIDPVLR